VEIADKTAEDVNGFADIIVETIMMVVVVVMIGALLFHLNFRLSLVLVYFQTKQDFG
jgi:hypothetical protein